jgi:UDP-glucose 4-epimerase
MSEKAVITGGAGFIGLHLARELVAAGWRVELIDLLNGVAAELFLDAELVVHLAAIVGVSHVMRTPYDVLRNNVGLLEAALGAAAKSRKLRRFLFTSTSEVYAPAIAADLADIPTPESTQLVLGNPGDARGSYLLSKIYGEAMCLQSGLPVTIVRPHNIYGPRMGVAHVVPELMSRALKASEGGKLVVASPTHTRTFCYIDDAVVLMLALIDNDEAVGKTVNLGAQAPEIPIRALAETIIEVVGCDDSSLVPGPNTPGSPERRCPDVSLLTRLTGRSASTSLAEGLARTYDWYRSGARLVPEIA